MVEVDELCVPWVDDLGHVGADKGLGDLGWSVILHVSTELNNLLEDWALDIWERNLFTIVFINHAPYQNRLLCDIAVNKNNFTVLTNELYFAFCHSF